MSELLAIIAVLTLIMSLPGTCSGEEADGDKVLALQQAYERYRVWYLRYNRLAHEGRGADCNVCVSQMELARLEYERLKLQGTSGNAETLASNAVVLFEATVFKGATGIASISGSGFLAIRSSSDYACPTSMDQLLRYLKTAFLDYARTSRDMETTCSMDVDVGETGDGLLVLTATRVSKSMPRDLNAMLLKVISSTRLAPLARTNGGVDEGLTVSMRMSFRKWLQTSN